MIGGGLSKTREGSWVEFVCTELEWQSKLNARESSHQQRRWMMNHGLFSWIQMKSRNKVKIKVNRNNGKYSVWLLHGNTWSLWLSASALFCSNTLSSDDTIRAASNHHVIASKLNQRIAAGCIQTTRPCGAQRLLATTLLIEIERSCCAKTVCLFFAPSHINPKSHQFV